MLQQAKNTVKNEVSHVKGLIKDPKSVVTNLNKQTPDKAKKSRNVGFYIAGVGLVIKIAAALFPATMPAGIAALAPEIIGFGTLVAGYNQTKKK